MAGINLVRPQRPQLLARRDQPGRHRRSAPRRRGAGHYRPAQHLPVRPGLHDCELRYIRIHDRSARPNLLNPIFAKASC